MRILGYEIPATYLVTGEWKCGGGYSQFSSTWTNEDFVLSPDLLEASSEIVEHLVRQGRKLNNDVGTSMRDYRCVDDRLEISLVRSCYYHSLLQELDKYRDDPDIGQLSREVKKKYYERCRDLRNSPFPNRPALIVSVVTSDGKTILTKRSAKTAVSGSSYASVVSGGIRPSRGDCDGVLPAPVKAIIRQTKEEIGLDLDLDKRDSLVFTCLAQDEEKFFTPMLSGILTCGLSSAELKALVSKAEDRWESTNWIEVDNNPDSIMEFLRDHSEEMVTVAQLAMVELARSHK